jgi:hypothetical protein
LKISCIFLGSNICAFRRELQLEATGITREALFMLMSPGEKNVELLIFFFPKRFGYLVKNIQQKNTYLLNEEKERK